MPLGTSRETVNVAMDVPALPSACERSLTLRAAGASSSVIVPTPWPSWIVACTGFVRSTVKVSSNSSSVSPLTATLTVFEVWPGVKVSEPLPEVKSAPAEALADVVVQSTVTVRPLASVERDREHGVGRAGVALDRAHVVDGDAGLRVVVRDGPRAEVVGDRGVHGHREVHGEGLVALVEDVADDAHGDDLRGLARGERQRAGSRPCSPAPRWRCRRPSSSSR